MSAPAGEEMHLLLVGREPVVCRAELFPSSRRVGDPASAIGIHEHDGGKTSVQVPEDVAMEEPGSWVVGHETEGGAGSTGSGDITTRRVDKVHGVGTVGLHDPEVVTVEMDRVSIIIIVGREGNINNLVARKNEGVLGDVEVRSIISASEDLNEGRDDGRDVGDVVDIPLSLAGGDFQNEGDVDISSLASVGEFVDQGDEVGLNEFGCDGGDGDGSSGVRIGGTIVAQDTTRERDVEVRVSSGISTDVGEVDPVVADSLVSIEDDIVTLAGKDINTGDGVRLSRNTIDGNDGQVVLVDGDGEFTTDGLGNDTETVALAGGDLLDGEGNCRAVDEAASTVHGSRVSDGDKTGSNISIDEAEGGVVPPVTELDDGALVIDIIEAALWVLGIIDDQRSTKTIQILNGELRVVPESSSLFTDERNFVSEASVRSDGACRDKGAALIPGVGGAEEDTVKVHGGTATHGGVSQAVVDMDTQCVALVGPDQRTRVRSVSDDDAPFEAIRSKPRVGDFEGDIDSLRRYYTDQKR